MSLFTFEPRSATRPPLFHEGGSWTRQIIWQYAIRGYSVVRQRGKHRSRIFNRIRTALASSPSQKTVPVNTPALSGWKIFRYLLKFPSESPVLLFLTSSCDRACKTNRKIQGKKPRTSAIEINIGHSSSSASAMNDWLGMLDWVGLQFVNRGWTCTIDSKVCHDCMIESAPWTLHNRVVKGSVGLRRWAVSRKFHQRYTHMVELLLSHFVSPSIATSGFEIVIGYVGVWKKGRKTWRRKANQTMMPQVVGFSFLPPPSRAISHPPFVAHYSFFFHNSEIHWCLNPFAVQWMYRLAVKCFQPCSNQFSTRYGSLRTLCSESLRWYPFPAYLFISLSVFH